MHLRPTPSSSRRFHAPVALTLLAASAAFADGPAFQPLGLSDPNFIPYSWAYAISGDGHYVVGTAVFPTINGERTLAFRWSNVGYEILGDLPGGELDSTAYAVSSDGSAIAGYSESGLGREAFRWTAAAGMQPLGALAAGPDFYSAAWGISADGSTVVGISTLILGQTYSAFRWTAGQGMADLGAAPGFDTSWAAGCSGNGALICGSINLSGTDQGFGVLWTAPNVFQSLGNFGLTAITSDGSAGAGSDGSIAYRWTAQGELQPLGNLPGGQTSNPWACSSQASVIVGSYLPAPSSTYSSACIWNVQRGSQDLKQALIAAGADSLQGWSLINATGISGDGTLITGNAIDPQGHHRGYLAHLAAPCLANCDNSTAAPILNVNDFLCFLNRFAARDPYANCDASTVPPVLNVNDFICFINHFTAGCP